MRIATAGFSHESNSFYSQPTQLEDFGVCEGADVISQYAGTFHEIAGYIAGAEEFGYELYPLLATAAMPGGPVTADTYEHFVGRILSGLGGGSQARWGAVGTARGHGRRGVSLRLTARPCAGCARWWATCPSP